MSVHTSLGHGPHGTGGEGVIYTWLGGTQVSSSDPLSYEWHQESTGLSWHSLTNGHNCSDEDDGCYVHRIYSRKWTSVRVSLPTGTLCCTPGLDNACINTSSSGLVGTLVCLTVCSHIEHCSGGVRDKSTATSGPSSPLHSDSLWQLSPRNMGGIGG